MGSCCGTVAERSPRVLEIVGLNPNGCEAFLFYSSFFPIPPKLLALLRANLLISSWTFQDYEVQVIVSQRMFVYKMRKDLLK